MNPNAIETVWKISPVIDAECITLVPIISCANAENLPEQANDALKRTDFFVSLLKSS